VLDRKNQIILYGPPGTGKTYWAELTGRSLAAYARYGMDFDQLSDDQKTAICGDDLDNNGLVRMCSFHPAYGYEDFLEGYRPQSVNGQLVFEPRDGIFKKLCEDAGKNSEYKFYLIIDEINRGDIPRIFGELLTILEKDKRNKSILLPLSGKPFQVPPNVFVIGTMNTADRSIALLDTALRRRFGFVELMPDSSVLGDATVAGIPLGVWLDALNRRLREYIGRDARNLQIGHAYLLDEGRPVTSLTKFARIVQDDILPLLEEYCYEDYATLVRILGNSLVDEKNQCIRHELFEPARQDELVRALLNIDPDITTSSRAVTSEAVEPEEELGGDDKEMMDDESDEASLT
jgi:5-methylcytosine-specific restriction protein B